MLREVRKLKEAKIIREQIEEVGHTSYLQAMDEMFRNQNPEYSYYTDMCTEDLEEQIERLERDYLDLVANEFRIDGEK